MLQGLVPDTGVAALAGGPSPLLILFAAVLLDLVAGRSLGAPARLLARLSDGLAVRLNRPHRGAGTRVIRGLLLVALVMAGAAGVAAVVAGLAARLPYGWVALVVATASLLDVRRGLSALRAAAAVLATGDLNGARALAGDALGAPARRMDRIELAVALIRGFGLRLNDGLVAAALWYVLLGLPGLAAYRALAVVAARLPAAGSGTGLFGLAAARAHAVLGAVPAGLSALWLAAASPFVPGARSGAALAAALRPAKRPLAAEWPGGVVLAACGWGAQANATPGLAPVAVTGTALRRATYLAGVATFLAAGALGVIALYAQTL